MESNLRDSESVSTESEFIILTAANPNPQVMVCPPDRFEQS